MYSFKDFLIFLWSRKKIIQITMLLYIIVLCGVFISMRGFQYSNQVAFLIPVTEISAQGTTNAEDDEFEKENEIINSNLKLIHTYKEIVKSDLLIQKIQKSNPRLSTNDIRDSLKVTSNLDSQIFTITITTNDSLRSTEIATALSKNLPEVAQDMRLPKKIFLLSTDSFQTRRSPSFIKLIISCLFIAFIFGTSTVFFWFYFYERKFVKDPVLGDSLVGFEIIGMIDFYKSKI
ncbi:hypothetical protein [Enterococcus faecium]|uniref:hypothetical protein n=1 Tax=Enterococcus TaxID=1350 RepID=UPI000CF035C5|nr:hypothetical protein [Enterococcus faecium]EGP4874481.1 hypothetical protein [Enterococcus faecium]EGP5401477.1 hypothetical protein [Enterococcus faecium]EGP5632631.1 hypothetical protein [Enterococcus faecium]MBS6012358.1 hypothetical protein [Enterococcus faecium]PQC79996.1 hypothetical protein CUM69_08600 [Enterococcus faecium]